MNDKLRRALDMLSRQRYGNVAERIEKFLKTGDHDTSGGKYNQFVLEDNELGEKHVAEVTDHGVYLDHNWQEGCQFIPHETWDKLDEHRVEFLIEIGEEP